MTHALTDIDEIAASGQSAPLITSEMISLFQQEGFLSIDKLISEDSLASVRNTIERLFESRSGFSEGAFFDFTGTREEKGVFELPQLIDPRSFAPSLIDSEFFLRARDIARALLGPKAMLASDHAMLKPALNGPITPWHQDEAFQRSGPIRDEVSIWMPLQRVDHTNGCMSFIPGSHKWRVLPHRSLGGDDRIHALECYAGFDPQQAVSCPIPAGGCTIHTSRTLHTAGPNKSAYPRFAYILVFQRPATAMPLPQEKPWLSNKTTAQMNRRRAWMQGKGCLIHSWRRIKQTKEIGLREMLNRVTNKITDRFI